MPWLPRAVEAVRNFRARRLATTAAAGVESSGKPIEEIIEAAAENPLPEQFTADVLEAASRSAFEAKLVALGRAWAQGVLTQNDGELAREQQFVRSIARLYPDIRVLDVISGDFFAAAAKLALVDGWTPEAVRGQLPEYGVLVDQLVSVLGSEGLVANQTIQNPMVAGTQFRITPAGEDLLARIRAAAE